MSAQTRPIEGVVPVVQTPINGDGSIDVESQGRLVQHLLTKKIGGMWSLGTGSEDMNLNFEKRVTAAQAVAEANDGQVPVVMGTGFFALDDILNFISATRDLNVDAYHVMPYHPLLSLDRLDWFYKRIADHSVGEAGKPVWMYTSGNWAQYIPPAFVKNLKDYPGIAGVKFSSSNAPDQLKVLALADDNFQIITAVASQFYACLSMGSRAGTSSLASVLPDPLIEIHSLHKEGRHDEALEKQRILSSFLAEMPKTIKADNFLGAAEEKYILSLYGLCKPFTTSYYRDLNEDEQNQVRSCLKKYGYAPDLEL